MTQPPASEDPWTWSADPPAEPAPAPDPTRVVDPAAVFAARPSEPIYSEPIYSEPTYTQSSGAADLRQPAYYQPPPSPGGGNRSKIIAVIVAVVIAAGLAVGAVFVLGSDDGTSAGQQTRATGATPSFPATLTSTGSPSPSGSASASGPAAATSKAQLADIAQRFFHAIGANDVATFCGLADAQDLADFLKTNSLATCKDVSFADAAADRKAALAALIIDSTKVNIVGTSAFVLEAGYSPDTARPLLHTILFRADTTSGAWKVRVS